MGHELDTNSLVKEAEEEEEEGISADKERSLNGLCKVGQFL